MASLPWLNADDFTLSGMQQNNDSQSLYFSQLSQFLQQNPTGTIDLKSLNDPSTSMDRFLVQNQPVSSPEDKSSPSDSASSHTYNDLAFNIHVPQAQDFVNDDMYQATRQSSAESNGFPNRNGKRANSDDAKTAQHSIKDRKPSGSGSGKPTAKGQHTHEETDAHEHDEELTKNSKKKGGSTSDRRKEQNRNAQRAFRDRKEQHAKKLEDQVAVLEEAASLRDAENKILKDLVLKLQSENARLSAFDGTPFTFTVPTSSSTTASLNSSLAQPSTGPKTSSSLVNSGSAASARSFTSATNYQPNIPLASSASATTLNTYPNATLEELLAEPLFTPSGDHLNFSSFNSFPLTSSSDGLGGEMPVEDALSPNTSANLFTAYRESSDEFLATSSANAAEIAPWAGYADLDDLFGLAKPVVSPALSPSSLSTLDSQYQEALPSLTSTSSASSVQSSSSEKPLECPLKPILQNVRGSEDYNLDALCNDLFKKATCTEAAKLAATSAIANDLTFKDLFSGLGDFNELDQAYKR